LGLAGGRQTGRVVVGDRRERRVRRARRRRIAVLAGVAVVMVVAAVAVAAATLGPRHEAAAGATDAPVTAPSTTTTTTIPPTTTTTRPPVNAAFPPAPEGSGTGRRIVYCNSCQRVWLMEDDLYASASYAVSGRRGTPSSGTYHVIRKLENGYAKSDPSLRLPYFVGFTSGATTDIGFHGIPLRRNGSPIQSESQLGTPLSHGCIRQHQLAAKLLYDWAPVGTTVVVTP
jgi:hypothetical protein